MAVRAPLDFAAPLTGGTPNVRSPLVFTSAPTSGQPNVRTSLVFVNVPTGGNPNVRCALMVIQALIPVPKELPVATDIFPTLIGLTYDVKKSPEFNTAFRSVTSGRETTNAFMQYPWWNFELTYDFLGDIGNPWNQSPDMRTLAGFFLQMQGRYKAWLFKDPDDNRVVGGTIATADGVTLQWPFFRGFGGFYEPVGQVDRSTLFTFLPAAVTTGSHTIALPNHGLTTAAAPPLFVSSTGTLPGGLSALTPYWPIVIDANTIKFATSAPNALAGTAVAISTQGTGVHTIAKGFAVYETVLETDSVPAMGPYTITVTHASVYIEDLGVTLSGVPLVEVPSSPATGQYSVNEATGVYTFNSAQASASVVINYTYQADPTNVSLTLPNQLVFGVAPASGLVISADFDFWFVCRFLDDKTEFTKFMDLAWENQKIGFKSVIQ